jgi:hypothetical protein
LQFDQEKKKSFPRPSPLAPSFLLIKPVNMFRSVFARTSQAVRTITTQAIKPPKTPVNLAHLADNPGAISEV